MDAVVGDWTITWPCSPCSALFVRAVSQDRHVRLAENSKGCTCVHVNT